MLNVKICSFNIVIFCQLRSFVYFFPFIILKRLQYWILKTISKVCFVSFFKKMIGLDETAVSCSKMTIYP